MKRELPSISSVDEPQRNVRSRNTFAPSMPRERVVSLDQPHVNLQPRLQFMAPNLLTDHQSPTSTSGESISQFMAPNLLADHQSDTSVSCESISQFMAPNLLADHQSPTLVSGEGISQVMAPNLLADNLSPTSVSGGSISQVMAPNLLVDHQSPTSISGESISRVMASISQVLAPNLLADHQSPTAVSGESISQFMAPNLLADRQSPTSVSGESISQFMAPNLLADHQSPTSISGESISQVMASLSQFLVANLFADHQSPTSVSDDSISSSPDTPQGLQELAGSTSPHICEHCGGLMSASEDRSVSLPSTSPIDGPQNPHIIQAVRHRDMDMDINNWSYEELLELEERIGRVNTGIKTSELSKFVKEVIFCGEQDEAERCVICQEQYADADVKGQLKCGHEYHFSCIGKWMEEQAVCPICRQRAAHFE